MNVTIDGVKSVIDASLGNRNPFWVRKLKIRLMNAAQVPIILFEYEVLEQRGEGSYILIKLDPFTHRHIAVGELATLESCQVLALHDYCENNDVKIDS